MDRALTLKKEGNTAFGSGELDQAIAKWKHAIVVATATTAGRDDGLDKLLVACHANVSAAYLKTGKPLLSLQAADRALAVSRASHKSWFRRARALQSLGSLFDMMHYFAISYD